MDNTEKEFEQSMLSPILPFQPNQEVIIYDNEDDIQRGMFLRQDGDDFIVSVDGVTRISRKTVLINSTYYRG